MVFSKGDCFDQPARCSIQSEFLSCRRWRDTFNFCCILHPISAWREPFLGWASIHQASYGWSVEVILLELTEWFSDTSHIIQILWFMSPSCVQLLKLRQGHLSQVPSCVNKIIVNLLINNWYQSINIYNSRAARDGHRHNLNSGTPACTCTYLALSKAALIWR